MLSTPALRVLRDRHPGAKIDLLVNKSVASVGPLLSGVNQLIEFDRDLLQDGLAQADRPLFEPFDRLRKFVSVLNSHDYDLVVNLTQNKLSGYLASMIRAKDHLGLALNSSGQPTYGSTWFKFLNDVVASGSETAFHYSDIFAHGVSFEGQEINAHSCQLQLVETAKGRSEVEAFFAKVGYRSGPKVVVQALTSDDKKNWGLAKWAAALAQLKVFEPECHLLLLGAPHEEEKLNGLRSSLEALQVPSDLAILSLEGALSLLSVSDLLITGDTSIKHMASATGIQILELVLGSSDLRKTGVYKENSLILKNRESCSPCSHEKACSRAQHDCAIRVSAEVVALSATKFLRKDWPALRTIAEEYSDEVEVLRSTKLAFGVWTAVPLHDKPGAVKSVGLSRQLDLAAWKFFLDKEHLKPLAEYGSSGLRLKDQLDLDGGTSDVKWLHVTLEQLENSTAATESRLNRVLSELSRRVRVSGGLGDYDFLDPSLRSEIAEIEKALGLGQFLSEKMALQSSTGLFRARQLQSSLNETFSFQQIKLKLIRSLRSHLTEYQ